jgi:hypothetical protein
MSQQNAFADVLNAAEQLDVDAQEELVAVLSRRLAERGRAWRPPWPRPSGIHRRTVSAHDRSGDSARSPIVRCTRRYVRRRSGANCGPVANTRESRRVSSVRVRR